jgi:peroxiredoxin
MFSASGTGPKVRLTLPALGGFSLAAALMYAFFAGGLKDPLGPLPNPDRRHVFPDFTLGSLGGHPWTLSAQRGNVLVVNLFGRFCGPCRLEMPSLIRIARRYESAGLKVVGISVDEDAMQTAPGFVRQFQIPYPVLACDPPGAGETAEDERTIVRCKVDSLERIPASHLGSAAEGVPITFLIDRRGRLSRVYYGYSGAYQDRLLDADVRHLLEEQAVLFPRLGQ